MDLKQHIKRLEESHIKPDMRESVEKLDEVLADAFFEIGSSGFMYDKRECLETGGVLADMSLHNFEMYPLAEGVVLTTYFIVDTTRNRNSYRSSIWKLMDGRWQLYFHQGTISPLSLEEVLKKA